MEVQIVKDRMAKKKVLTFFPPAVIGLARRLLSLEKAKSQKEVLRFLLEHPQPIRLTELMLKLDVGASAVKSLADKGWVELREVEVYRDPYADRSFPKNAAADIYGGAAAVFNPISEAVRIAASGISLAWRNGQR